MYEQNAQMYPVTRINSRNNVLMLATNEIYDTHTINYDGKINDMAFKCHMSIIDT